MIFKTKKDKHFGEQMKLIVLLASVFLFCGCSSNSKKVNESSSPAIQSSASSKSSTDSKAQPAVKKEAKKKDSKMPAKSKSSAAVQGDTVVCTYGKVTREIRVEDNSGGCSVHYTKDGSTKVIGKSTAGSAYCQNLQKRVQGNLESSGFKCE
jgi:hypothetical protein